MVNIGAERPGKFPGLVRVIETHQACARACCVWKRIRWGGVWGGGREVSLYRVAPKCIQGVYFFKEMASPRLRKRRGGELASSPAGERWTVNKYITWYIGGFIAHIGGILYVSSHPPGPAWVARET